MEYNSNRPNLLMREYGRHIQKMVDYVKTIENREKRQQNAEAIIEMIAFFNPGIKTMEDYRHKLWDHLFIMSNFDLDVDCPYPIPDRETYYKKPDSLPYPKRKPRYSHLGKNLELVINKALEEEVAEKKSGFAHTIAHYMKLAYSTWHKELMHDDNIRQELDAITHGELEFTNTPYVRHRPAPFNDELGYGNAKRGNKFKQNKNRNNGGGNRNKNRGKFGKKRFQ